MKPELLDYELLVKAKSLIDTPEKWLKGKSHNEWCYASSTAFCSAGAFQMVMGGNKADDLIWLSKAWVLLMQAAQELGRGSPVEYNDTHTHSEVMKMWDMAIAKAEAKAR